MNSEKHQELRTRTKAFALRIIRMSQALPRSREANVLVQQILRSATGMAANYRAAGRSRSKAEFIAKIGVVVEEADETVFWLEMLADSGLVRSENWKICVLKLLNWSRSLLPPVKQSGLRHIESPPISRDVVRLRRFRAISYFRAFVINAPISFFNSPRDESWIYIMCPAP